MHGFKQHSSVENNSRCAVVGESLGLDTYTNMQSHMSRHIVHTRTEKLYNMTPLGVKTPRKLPQKKCGHKGNGFQTFRMHNCFNLALLQI